MKKIANDIIDYLNGSSQFMPAANGEDPWAYPIDLEFTLRDEPRYYHPKDAAGLPIRHYRSVGEQYTPTRIAAYALAHWNRSRVSGADGSHQLFLRCADWFVDSADQGRWRYHFDWLDLKAPWISCMSQGEGISVLTRASMLTGDARYAEAAQNALGPFRLDVADGGVRSTLPTGSAFFEEYPSRNPIHVLNGYLYALVGLVDLQRLGPTEEVGRLLEQGRETLEQNLRLWDHDGWSLYDLHNLGGPGRNFTTAAYHRLQVTQLRYLGSALQSPLITGWADRWEQAAGHPGKRLRAAVGKIRYRLHNPAQR